MYLHGFHQAGYNLVHDQSMIWRLLCRASVSLVDMQKLDNFCMHDCMPFLLLGCIGRTCSQLQCLGAM